MPMLLQKELEKLKKQILSLGAMVEEQFNMAIKAVETKDHDMAVRVIDSDHNIDEIEVEVEEECLKVLALHQPVAVDLRFIVAVIKINNDLERIGDEAVNIAERVAYIASRPNVPVRFDYRLMAEKTKAMVNRSLDSLVNLDVELAYQVRLQDDEVDKINREIYEQIREVIREYPDRGGYLINLFSISRHLERIADHATNIAEEVIYMVEGVIKRHPRSQKRPK
jgi:phosphate transport system protein